MPKFAKKKRYCIERAERMNEKIKRKKETAISNQSGSTLRRDVTEDRASSGQLSSSCGGMSFENVIVKMEEFEAEDNETLHSLQSGECHNVGSKEGIIKDIPSDQRSKYGENQQWPMPIKVENTVINMQEIEQACNIKSEPLEEEHVDMEVETKSKAEKNTVTNNNIKQESDNDNFDNKLEETPAQVKERLKQGCGCRYKCYRELTPEEIYRHRSNVAKLSKKEYNMYLIGITMASLTKPAETCRRIAKRMRARYVYQGRKVCQEAFLYLENVTRYKLKQIRHHVMTHGVEPISAEQKPRRQPDDENSSDSSS